MNATLNVFPSLKMGWKTVPSGCIRGRRQHSQHGNVDCLKRNRWPELVWPAVEAMYNLPHWCTPCQMYCLKVSQYGYLILLEEVFQVWTKWSTHRYQSSSSFVEEDTSLNRSFRPQLYSGRSAEKKLVATVGIEPRPLAQESETILIELAHHLLRVWRFKILTCHGLLILILAESTKSKSQLIHQQQWS